MRVIDCFAQHYSEARKGLDDLATGGTGGKPIHPNTLQRFWMSLRQKMQCLPAMWVRLPSGPPVISI